ncbi:MAG TPA: DUF4340 domain-containing protein [Bacteroidales bacterium]|nr:DUF4340 domain-containing protein [Bacteroidales bacterium]HSA43533.1 DUF4340 domain-containing protein [Bacteroidales bacterium]
MKKNTIILIITLVLAIVTIWLFLNRSKTTLRSSEKDFAIHDTASVVRIFMADKTGEQVDLMRSDSGVWTVNREYPARPDGINILLKTMQNLAVVEPVSKTSRNLIIKQLASTGIKVEIYQKVHRINIFNGIRLFPAVKKTRVYYVGSNTPDNHGTYMIMEGSETPFITYLPGFRGFVAVRYSPRLADWRTHFIFNTQISDIQSVSVDFNEVPGHSWRAIRSGERSFSLESTYTRAFVPDYDTGLLLHVLATFSDIRFETLVTGASKERRDSITSSRPFHTVTLTDIRGKTFIVKTFHRENPGDDPETEGTTGPWDRDRMYALVNDGMDFVLVQFFVFDNILRPVDDFLKIPATRR